MIHSTSTIKVLSSSYVKLARPMHFFRHLFILRINLSQNPPHQGARSTINLQLILWFFKWQMTSGDQAILMSSLEEVLNVLALSEINVAGRPRRAAKRRNNNRKESTDKSGANSKCTALVEAHVNTHM